MHVKYPKPCKSILLLSKKRFSKAAYTEGKEACVIEDDKTSLWIKTDFFKNKCQIQPETAAGLDLSFSCLLHIGC